MLYQMFQERFFLRLVFKYFKGFQSKHPFVTPGEGVFVQFIVFFFPLSDFLLGLGAVGV